MYIPGTRVWISYLEARRVDAAVGAAHRTAHGVAVEIARRDQLALVDAALHVDFEAIQTHPVKKRPIQPAFSEAMHSTRAKASDRKRGGCSGVKESLPRRG